VRRLLTGLLVAVLAFLALFSWYMAGFFRRYELVVGEGKHFRAWAFVADALMLAFTGAAFYVAFRKRASRGL
jgi:hypothetical protein